MKAKSFRKADVFSNINLKLVHKMEGFIIFNSERYNHHPSWFFIGPRFKLLNYIFMVRESCEFMILVSYWSKRLFKHRFRTIIVEILELRERLLERQQGKGFWKGKSQGIDNG